MFIAYRIAACTDFTLNLLKEAVPGIHGYLPMGGSALAQMGLLFASAHLVLEVIELRNRRR